MPNCCIDLKETLCHLPNVNDYNPVIPNTKTNFIHNIQYFIDQRKPLGKKEWPP